MTPADIFSPFHTENRRTIPANTYHFNKDLTMKGKSDLQSCSKASDEEEGDYEIVSSSTLEAIRALRILPAKPLQESEYADKRCLRPSGTTSPVNNQHTSQPPQHSAVSKDLKPQSQTDFSFSVIPFKVKCSLFKVLATQHSIVQDRPSSCEPFLFHFAPTFSPLAFTCQLPGTCQTLEASQSRAAPFLLALVSRMMTNITSLFCFINRNTRLFQRGGVRQLLESFDFSRPLKTLPKQYQPLPPEPKISSQFFHMRKTLSQAHTFPISAKVTRYGCIPHPHSLRIKTLFLVKPRDFTSIAPLFLLKKKKLFFRQLHLEENKVKKYNFFPSEFTFTGSTLNVENSSVNRSPSPTPYTACKYKSKQSLVKQEMQSLTQPTEKDLNKYEWYIGEYDRHEAEKALLQENTDETFLVRDCSQKSNAEPYVLVVYYGRRVYNIKVRFLEESQQYALGTGLRGEDKFNSVKEIIDFYKYVPITLIDGKDKSGFQREQCYLTYPFRSRKRCFLP
ncbi:cytokine-dependent hematopoietic cell linker [Pluvialis apricaria]